MAVLIFAVVVIMPNLLKRMSGYQLDQSATAVFSALRSAQTQAIGTSRPVEVEIDAGAAKLTVRSDADGDGSFAGDEIKELVVSRSPSFSLAAPAGVGTFRARGTFASAAGLWEIRVDYDSAGSRYIYVFPSGQVERSRTRLQ